MQCFLDLLTEDEEFDDPEDVVVLNCPDVVLDWILELLDDDELDLLEEGHFFFFDFRRDLFLEV